MALPGSAAAISDCSYAGSADASVGGAGVYIYGNNVPGPVGGGGGRTGSAFAGVCVDGAPNPPADGGYVEVGSTATGPYGVIDGSDANPSGQAQGYGAVGNGPETGTKDPCQWAINNQGPNGEIADPSDNGTGSNSSGCFTVRNPTTGAAIVSVAGVPIACGATTGPDWRGPSSRDGCRVP